MNPGIPIRISASNLQGEHQFPERGLFHVPSHEAELIARMAVLGIARERMSEDATTKEVYAESKMVLAELERDIYSKLVGSPHPED